jgi:heme/copper-type cytochrome/quinol oxidase subunit 1
MRRWAVATKVYALGVNVLVLASVVEALLIRSQLVVPSSVLMSEDLYQDVWTAFVTARVLLVALPAIAAIAMVWVPRLLGVDRVAWPRLANVGAWVWLLGAVLLTEWWATTGRHGGWFNYTPGQSAIDLGAHSWRQAVGGILACVGLALTAVTLLVTAIRARPSAADGSPA